MCACVRGPQGDRPGDSTVQIDPANMQLITQVGPAPARFVAARARSGAAQFLESESRALQYMRSVLERDLRDLDTVTKGAPRRRRRCVLSCGAQG